MGSAVDYHRAIEVSVPDVDCIPVEPVPDTPEEEACSPEEVVGIPEMVVVLHNQEERIVRGKEVLLVVVAREVVDTEPVDKGGAVPAVDHTAEVRHMVVHCFVLVVEYVSALPHPSDLRNVHPRK